MERHRLRSQAVLGREDVALRSRGACADEHRDRATRRGLQPRARGELTRSYWHPARGSTRLTRSRRGRAAVSQAWGLTQTSSRSASRSPPVFRSGAYGSRRPCSTASSEPMRLATSTGAAWGHTGGQRALARRDRSTLTEVLTDEAFAGMAELAPRFGEGDGGHRPRAPLVRRALGAAPSTGSARSRPSTAARPRRCRRRADATSTSTSQPRNPHDAFPQHGVDVSRDDGGRCRSTTEVFDSALAELIGGRGLSTRAGERSSPRVPMRRACGTPSQARWSLLPSCVTLVGVAPAQAELQLGIQDDALLTSQEPNAWPFAQGPHAQGRALQRRLGAGRGGAPDGAGRSGRPRVRLQARGRPWPGRRQQSARRACSRS